MKIRGKSGLQALVLGTLFLSAVLPAVSVFATEPVDEPITDAALVAPTILEPLYRVRTGDMQRGEIAGRFYIERNIITAQSVLQIDDDYDPDDDGWALVGHSDIANDGKTKTHFWIDIANKPHLLLNAMDHPTCAQLTPVSLAAVAEDQDRLLLAEHPDLCPRPMFGPTDIEPQEPTAQPETSLVMPDPQPQLQAEQPVVPVAPAQPVPETVHEPIHATLSPLVIDAIQEGRVASVSTTKTPNFFDGHSKNSAEVTNQIGNTFLIGVSIIFAVLLAIVLLVRSIKILGK